MVNGYLKFCDSKLPGANIYNTYIVVVICPYTKPEMVNKTNPKQGYVFYDTLFKNKKMPTDTSLIPF